MYSERNCKNWYSSQYSRVSNQIVGLIEEMSRSGTYTQAGRMVGCEQSSVEGESGTVTSNNLLGKDGVRNRGTGMQCAQLWRL